MRKRSELDLITQYLEVNFDHLTIELAACLPLERPGSLRQQEAASHLRVAIRALMGYRGQGQGIEDANMLIAEMVEITGAEKDLLRQRLSDVVSRAGTAPSNRVGPAKAPARANRVGPTRRPARNNGYARGAVAALSARTPITERAGLGAAGVRSVLQALATKSLDLLHADICQVYLEQEDTLTLQAEAPDPSPATGPHTLNPEEGFMRMVRAAGRAISIDDASLLEGFERTWIERGAMCLAAVPVGAAGDPGSGLLVAVRVTLRPFTQQEAVEMARLADEVTLSMASADLLSRAEELAVLKERMKLAREIHDGLASDLSAVVQMFKYHEHRRRIDPVDADQLLVQMQELVAGALQSARDILATLRPRQMAPRHLAEAVRQQVEVFSRTYGVSGVTRVLGQDTGLVAEEREAIFQVVRESLTNVRKHSRCATVQVTLDMRRRPFVLVVEDDGVGIHGAGVEEKSGSFGILGMRERAELLGGTLDIGNGDMGGARLEFHGPEVPLGA